MTQQKQPPKKRTDSIENIASSENAYFTKTLEPNFKNKNNDRYLGSNAYSFTDPQEAVAYFPGGKYDIRNRCSFSYFSLAENRTKSITLIVPPNRITWSYSLRTSVMDTYGGQVIQLLGVDIKDFKISGFMPTGFWGRYNENFIQNNFDAEGGRTTSHQYFEDFENTLQNSTNASKNGLVHLANFFRDFFTEKTQTSYTTKDMTFNYPHYDWKIPIIPFSFPRVRLSNEEILPEWELECSVVEHLASHFIGQVTKKGSEQLDYLKAGIGFSDFIQWSDPSATTDIDVIEQASQLGASYKSFVEQFDASEADVLAGSGFSYPPQLINTVSDKEIKKIIQNRFGVTVE